MAGHFLHFGSVAQLVEQLTLNQLVVGSNPTRSTRKKLRPRSGYFSCYTLDKSPLLRYGLATMSYLLITGIIFIVVPILLIQGFMFFIFLNFVRDDNDANSLFKLCLLALVFGIVLVLAHFIGIWLD